MRQVVLDTETTGLSPKQGHRITEIGCVEIINRKLTGRTFQTYLNPERAIDEAAKAITGLTEAFLQDKPKFHEIVDDFLAFVKDSELIIHNAPFDLGFIDAELEKIAHPWETIERFTLIIDTLVLAREKHPGQRNSLDALCSRYAVDNSGRQYHGALLDAEILAEVYLQMTAGQTDLGLSEIGYEKKLAVNNKVGKLSNIVIDLPIVQPTSEEMQAHKLMLQHITETSQSACLWSENVK